MAKIVSVGSARIDERGKARGGRAGDQNKREVSTQAWYNRTVNPWVVLRPKVAEHAEKIARCMEMACANQRIGYDQGGRDTLYNAARRRLSRFHDRKHKRNAYGRYLFDVDFARSSYVLRRDLRRRAWPKFTQ